jgi:hypothetical protein
VVKKYETTVLQTSGVYLSDIGDRNTLSYLKTQNKCSGFVVFIGKKRTILLEKYLQKTNMLKVNDVLLTKKLKLGF